MNRATNGSDQKRVRRLEITEEFDCRIAEVQTWLEGIERCDLDRSRRKGGRKKYAEILESIELAQKCLTQARDLWREMGFILPEQS